MMNFLSKLFQNEKRNIALALDIGTEVIKALVFEIDAENEKGYVIGVGRKRQRLEDMQAGAVMNIEGVVRQAALAIREAEDEARVKAEQVVLGIAGELVKGNALTLHYQRLKPHSKIDFDELKQIIQKVEWQAFDKVRKQLSFETGILDLDVKLINSAIVDVHIDGYRVTNPVGFQGKDVSISIFNAYAPLVHLGALQTIAQDLDLDLLSCAAEPYAVARCFGDESGEFSAIFIDIGGGTTDVALVRAGGIEGTKMFALGGQAFTKRIARELNVNFQKAESFKLQYSENKLSPDVKNKLAGIIRADLRVWLEGVRLALLDFPGTDHLPSKILLCGGGSRLPEIKKMLQDPAWTKTMPFAKNPEVFFIKPDDVANIIDKTGKLVDQQDITPMGLANLALELAGKGDVMRGILRKVVRTLQT